MQRIRICPGHWREKLITKDMKLLHWRPASLCYWGLLIGIHAIGRHWGTAWGRAQGKPRGYHSTGPLLKEEALAYQMSGFLILRIFFSVSWRNRWPFLQAHGDNWKKTHRFIQKGKIIFFYSTSYNCILIITHFVSEASGVQTEGAWFINFK